MSTSTINIIKVDYKILLVNAKLRKYNHERLLRLKTLVSLVTKTTFSHYQVHRLKVSERE
jgi:hypothetical protein